MPSVELIRRFIQDTLGCACPEEVFRSIEVLRNVRVNSFITLHSAIVVGNRLLVYVANAGTAGCVEEHLPVLVKAGVEERERKGLNRFRLVLLSDGADEVRTAAERLFNGLRGADDRVHLHVLGRNSLPW